MAKNEPNETDDKTYRKNKRSSPDKKQRGFLSKFFRGMMWAAVFVVAAGMAVITGAYLLYQHISQNLPVVSGLKDYRPRIITTVYSDDNRKIAEFYKERRIVVPVDEMPKMLINAFVAAEDSRFFTHPGVDIVSIVRAFLKNIEAGSVVQGGSTITQQITKSFLLSPERSYERKLKEAILAYRIDKMLNKEEILYLYLNQIYLGHGAYGVGAAAENYFGKSVKDLNIAECAMLAGLPKAPGRDSPFKHPEKAKERQVYVLKRMAEEGYITQAQMEESLKTELDIRPRQNFFIETAPYYTEYVRKYVEEKYGQDLLYEDGLQIYTAVNIEMQNMAREAVDRGLREFDKRHGFRGPVTSLKADEIQTFLKNLQESGDNDPEPEKIVQAVVRGINEADGSLNLDMGNARGILENKDMKWSGRRFKTGDVIMVRLREKKEDQWQAALEQTPLAQSALLCIEAETGMVKAMIGGRDFRDSQFNRAIQSRRQPGSAFKPVIYGAAIDKGYTPASMIVDNAVVYGNSGNLWKPKNYDNRFYGPTLLRKALAKSRNLATIKILDDIGVGYVAKYAKKIGIKSELYKDLSLALGSSGVSLLELVTAYSVFANQGELVEPVFISKILDREGNVLEEARPSKKQVIEKSSAYIMTNLLEEVVKHGTGYKAKELGRPVAGKTGTTNDTRDAWFVGYTPEFVTGAWVGFDEERSLGKAETGAKAAIPIWLGFMQEVMKDRPVSVFKVPRGVVFSKVDAQTGLLPVPESESVIFECFKEGTVPRRYSKRPGAVADAEQFFKSDL